MIQVITIIPQNGFVFHASLSRLIIMELYGAAQNIYFFQQEECNVNAVIHNAGMYLMRQSESVFTAAAFSKATDSKESIQCSRLNCKFI